MFRLLLCGARNMLDHTLYSDYLDHDQVPGHSPSCIAKFWKYLRSYRLLASVSCTRFESAQMPVPVYHLHWDTAHRSNYFSKLAYGLCNMH